MYDMLNDVASGSGEPDVPYFGDTYAQLWDAC
jgi:hypothetical protein